MHSFVEVTELKNSRSLNFLSLEIEYKISLKTDPVIGVRGRNQSVGIALDSQIHCWVSGIKSVWGSFLFALLFRII